MEQGSLHSVSRLWRPAAQRNLRNQCSRLASLRHQWTNSSSVARSHATSLVNAYLNHRNMPSMDLGVLNDMPGLRNKASLKLLKQQELHRSNLLSSYKDMVHIATQMVRTSKSFRCYLKGTSTSPLVQFSDSSEDKNDPGDGGGIPVFTFWSVSCFEKHAEELVQMFVWELNLKRFLVVELISISCEPSKINKFSWSDELYPGEFDDLSVCKLFSEETSEPTYPRFGLSKSEKPIPQFNPQPSQETLQVFLTTWLAEVNVHKSRVNEIFGAIGEEIKVNIS